MNVSPQDIISSKLCIGCGACAALEPTGSAALKWDRDGQLKPDGPEEWLTGRTQDFGRICPFSPFAADETRIATQHFPQSRENDPWIGRFESAYVGHAAELDFRAKASSGGMASWVATELLRQNMVDGVAHVCPSDGNAPAGKLFSYRISRTPDEVRQGAKSRYYPIELSSVLNEIRESPGRYAVVGIPCFIKAVRLLQQENTDLRSRIAFTLGIFCGHMKSRHMVESFAWQMGTNIRDVQRVDFRVKNEGLPANMYGAELVCRDGRSLRRDMRQLMEGDWGAGFFQNPACNFCDDVAAETADVAFGDAWIEPHSADWRGTNVVIARSAFINRMIKDAIAAGRLELRPVDAAFVRETQAAGLRQRREGLAYRLGWHRGKVHPRKRDPGANPSPSFRRKMVYRNRHHISRWTPFVFRLARRLNCPALFFRWGYVMLRLYRGLVYSRGLFGKVFERLERSLAGRQTPMALRPKVMNKAE